MFTRMDYSIYYQKPIETSIRPLCMSFLARALSVYRRNPPPTDIAYRTPTNNNEKTKQAKENRIRWELETERLVVKNGGLNEDGLEKGKLVDVAKWIL